MRRGCVLVRAAHHVPRRPTPGRRDPHRHLHDAQRLLQTHAPYPAMVPEDEDVDGTIEGAHGHGGTWAVEPLHCQQRVRAADSIADSSALAPMAQTCRRYHCHKCATYAALHAACVCRVVPSMPREGELGGLGAFAGSALARSGSGRKETRKCPQCEHLMTGQGKKPDAASLLRPIPSAACRLTLLGQANKVRGDKGLAPGEGLDDNRLPLPERFFARGGMRTLVGSFRAASLCTIPHAPEQLVVTPAPLFLRRVVRSVSFPAACVASLAAPSSRTATRRAPGREMTIVVLIVVNHVLI